MSKSFDIDKAGECLRNIVDNSRCGFCDKLSNIYLRCIYGHIACKECAEKDDGCFTCFTTFNSPVLNNTWVEDKGQSQKTKNALHLLNTFQDKFKIDVYRRQRISNQLKAEKELFPDCIQAPVKYSNKRKSLNTLSNYNKENSQQSYYPGENTSPVQKSKMEKSKYIQQWLEGAGNALPRKPLSNMNVNNQKLSHGHTKIIKHTPASRSSIVKYSNKSKRLTKKTKTQKTTTSHSLNKTFIDSLVKTPSMTIEKECNIKVHEQQDQPNKINKQDDSGIVMDEECIVIEGTPTKTVDKDELALQAVYEAEKKEYSDYISLHDDVDAQCNNKERVLVPYTRKSYLYASCPNCKKDGQNYANFQPQLVNDLSITIEYGDKAKCKQSISVQTEISDINKGDNTVTSSIKKNIDEQKFSTQKTSFPVKMRSQDLFTDDVDTLRSPNQEFSGKTDQITSDVVSFYKKDALIIEESDSDVEAEHLQVTAEVHRACMPLDYDILSDLPLIEIKNRKRRAKRGATPGSTDSSEKENFDPNRVKRLKSMKKGWESPPARGATARPAATAAAARPSAAAAAELPATAASASAAGPAAATATQLPATAPAPA